MKIGQKHSLDVFVFDKTFFEPSSQVWRTHSYSRIKCFCRCRVLWEPVPSLLWQTRGVRQQWSHVSLRRGPAAHAQDHGGPQRSHVRALPVSADIHRHFTDTETNFCSHTCSQVVLKHEGRLKEAAVLHHPPRWRLSDDVPRQQRAHRDSEEGVLSTSLERLPLSVRKVQRDEKI